MVRARLRSKTSHRRFPGVIHGLSPFWRLQAFGRLTCKTTQPTSPRFLNAPGSDTGFAGPTSVSRLRFPDAKSARQPRRSSPIRPNSFPAGVRCTSKWPVSPAIPLQKWEFTVHQGQSCATRPESFASILYRGSCR